MDFPTVTAPRRQPALVSVDGRTYPLRSAAIRARAEGGVAATTLIQEFANSHDEALEVIYTLPLPADGAVLGYTIHVGERVIRGEIEPREKAEADYRKALYEGKTAGLLEQDRADTFQQRLGNIPAHTDVRVEIEALQRLAFLPAQDNDPASWEYRFPMVVSVRYQGAPGRVPDAERVSPDRAQAGEIPTRFELDLSIADESAAGAPIASPSHAIRFDHTAGATIVKLEEGSPLDKDLVVRWRAATREVGVHLTEGPGLPGDDGRYALLTITPPEAPVATFRRDLTVLLDTSGSMSGAPLETAKRVVARLLESLAPEDRFEVLEFSHSTRRLMRDLVPATPEEIQSCIAKLEALRADGGTEMTTALLEALKPKDQIAQRQVVLVTDGQIGFEKEVLDEIIKAGSVVTRVHVVGVGSSPNRALTQGVARVGCGTEAHASDPATADEAAARMVAGTAMPVLVQLKVEGIGARGMAPFRPPDVFAGKPVVLALELAQGGGPIRVSGRLAGSHERWVRELEVPGAGAEGAPAKTSIPLGALYGRERIDDIELDLLEPGEGWKRVDREVEKIAMRHRIVSRRTSLVAIAEEPSVDPRAARRRERLPVEVPAGMSAEGLGLGGEIHMMHLMEPRSMARGGSLMAGLGEVVQDVGDFMSRLMTRATMVPPTDASGKRRAPELLTYDMPATLIRQDTDGILIEFEVPYGDFLLSTAGWSLEGPPEQKLLGVRKDSSGPGRHKMRTRVRIALRSTSGDELPDVLGRTVVYQQGTIRLRFLIGPDA